VTRAFLFLAIAVLASCESPEADRVRGGGPGADTGNRGNPVRMHEGSRPYHDTPRVITAEAPPLDSATQARELSRR
jgi:hypothetical protein